MIKQLHVAASASRRPNVSCDVATSLVVMAPHGGWTFHALLQSCMVVYKYKMNFVARWQLAVMHVRQVQRPHKSLQACNIHCNCYEVEEEAIFVKSVCYCRMLCL